MNCVYCDIKHLGIDQECSMISLSVVTDDGREFYAEFNDYNNQAITPYIQKNVINELLMRDLLTTGPSLGNKSLPAWGSVDKKERNYEHLSRTLVKGNTEQVLSSLQAWLSMYDKVYFVMDNNAIGWALFNKAYIEMNRLPENISHSVIDIGSMIVSKGREYVYELDRKNLIGGEHELNTALGKANQIKDCYKNLLEW